MRLTRLLLATALLLSGLLTTSCSTDDDSGGNSAREIPNQPIVASLIGVIYDLQNNPVEDALVSIGSQAVVTDGEGIYSFRDVPMNKAGTLVRASKDGYFTIIKLVNPSETAISSLNIQLLPRVQVGSFTAAQGGEFTTNGGGVVSIPPNAIMSSAGTPYSGQVVVSAYWLDPSSINVGDQMPGDLRGFAANNDVVQLATYGMMAVELTSPAGEELDILAGSVATLTLPIPSVLQADAPQEIPSWSMDELTGYWIEEGNADRIGDTYVAEVSHFSFWNCDAPFPLIEWSQQIVDQNGNPLSGLRVGLRLGNTAIARAGITNSNGVVSGKIPANEILTLSISTYAMCSSQFYVNDVGPFAANTVEPPISITPATSSAKYATISGLLVDCNNIPVSNGILKIANSPSGYPVASDGSFSITHLSCTASISFSLVDYGNQKATQVFTYPLPNPINSINVGTQMACVDLDEFIMVTTTGINYVDTEIDYRLDAPDLNTVSRTSDIGSYYTLYWNGSSIQDFSFDFFFNICDTQGNNCAFLYPDPSSTGHQVTITRYDGLGGFIEGEFSGNFINEDLGLLQPVTGSFRVRND